MLLLLCLNHKGNSFSWHRGQAWPINLDLNDVKDEDFREYLQRSTMLGSNIGGDTRLGPLGLFSTGGLLVTTSCIITLILSWCHWILSGVS